MRFGIWESILSGQHFRCSTIYAKRSFHRSVNAIFGKVGRIASEEVLIERFLMKLFRTVNHDVMRDCCMYLGFTLGYTKRFSEKNTRNLSCGIKIVVICIGTLALLCTDCLLFVLLLVKYCS